jgi:hypothetical protein
MPKDLWIVEDGGLDPKHESEYLKYSVFEDKSEAMTALQKGDSLYKIPAEAQEYLGTMKMELIK